VAERGVAALVAEADASIVQKAGEHINALERVAERLGDGIVARQLRSLALHPFDQLVDERGNVSAAHGSPVTVHLNSLREFNETVIVIRAKLSILSP
jgi:hypothetical protein